MLPNPNGSVAFPPVAFVPPLGKSEPPELVYPPELIPGVLIADGLIPGTGAPGTAPPMKGFVVTGAVGEVLVAACGRKVFAPELGEPGTAPPKET